MSKQFQQKKYGYYSREPPSTGAFDSNYKIKAATPSIFLSINFGAETLVFRVNQTKTFYQEWKIFWRQISIFYNQNQRKYHSI